MDRAHGAWMLRFILVLPLIGCAVSGFDREIDGAIEGAQELPTSVSYGFDQRCSLDPIAVDLAATGFSLWRTVGVNIVESDDPMVSVCLYPGEFWDGRYGTTGWTERDIEVTIRTDGLGWISAVAAHEMGHVVMESSEHLPVGEYGVMAGSIRRGGTAFTAADLELLDAHGITARPW